MPPGFKGSWQTNIIIIKNGHRVRPVDLVHHWFRVQFYNRVIWPLCQCDRVPIGIPLGLSLHYRSTHVCPYLVYVKPAIVPGQVLGHVHVASRLTLSEACGNTRAPASPNLSPSAEMRSSAP